MSEYKRDKLDRFYTPQACADACVKALAHEEGPILRVLEPSAGGGAFVNALTSLNGGPCAPSLLAGCDIDPEAEGMRLLAPNRRHTGDFLGLSPERAQVLIGGPVLWVIGNPPYRDAEAHVRHALDVSDRHVAFLLRSSFLGSQKRRDMWATTPLRKVWSLSPRPSFTGDGRTDGAEYALFWWDARHHTPPTLGWLDWDNGKRRGKR